MPKSKRLKPRKGYMVVGEVEFVSNDKSQIKEIVVTEHYEKTPKPLSDSECAKWYLQYLSEKASDLRPSDLEWSIKMQEAYKRQNGQLSKKQFDTLEGIYRKY